MNVAVVEGRGHTYYLFPIADELRKTSRLSRQTESNSYDVATDVVNVSYQVINVTFS